MNDTNVRVALFTEPIGPWARRISLLMGMSVVVAVFGMSANSAAVTIGAMLIAPLLEPVLGVGAAIAFVEPSHIARSFVGVLVSAIGAVGLAWLTTLVLVTNPTLTSEILARTGTNRGDLVIALAAGATAAWKITNDGEGASFAGAAIAVALVPPLATAGYTLALHRPDLAAGAMALFLVNVAAAVSSSGVVFSLSRRPHGSPESTCGTSS